MGAKSELLVVIIKNLSLRPKVQIQYMKSQLFSLVFVCLSLGCLAQKSSLYVKGGLNLSNISSINQSNYDDVKTVTGYHVGALLSIPVRSTVFIQPGLFISQKGSKMIYGKETDSVWFNATAKPLYIELPVSLVSNITTQNPAISFYVGAGLYAAWGIGGNNKGTYQLATAPIDFDDKINFKDDAVLSDDYSTWAGLGYMKQFDVGFISSVGMNAGKFTLSLAYSYGFIAVAREKETDDKNRNRVFSFGIGYRIL